LTHRLDHLPKDPIHLFGEFDLIAGAGSRQQIPGGGPLLTGRLSSFQEIVDARCTFLVIGGIGLGCCS
jgi:hypothetical protein